MPENTALKDVFHVAGDAPDPEGGRARGVAPGYELSQSAQGHPMLLYKLSTGQEIVLEADVYDVADKYIYLLCPLCLARGRKNMLRIREGIKAFRYDRLIDPPTFPGWSDEQMRHAFPRGLGGTLSVEPFECTWEESPELTRGGGFEKCGWRVSIEKNVVKDARSI